MPTKSRPTSLRISESVEQYAAVEANRTKRIKSAVYESLLDEAVRVRLFPGIAFRGSDWQREPWVIGAGVDVWEIVEAFEACARSPDRLTETTDIAESDLRLALSYYERFPQEIEEAIRENNLSLEELRCRFPTALFA